MDLAKIVPSRFLKCCKKPASTDQDSQAEQNDDGTNRATWSNKTEYLLSMVGYAVGLGNIWRFPYLTYKNGGGAFLIPYLIMMIFTGLPLYLLESALGQFAGLGPVLVWRAAPFFQGVGITMVIVSTLVCIYYNVIVAYALYYLFASFTKVLPWSYCFEGAEGVCSTHQTGICNVTSGSNNTVAVNLTWVKANNETCISNSTILHSGTLLSKEYWDKVALRRSSGLDETGVVVWPLALCLLLAWIMVAAALFKGIQSSGKVVYFSATFPYIILIILVVRGATLEGAMDGIDFYIGRKSNMTKLYESEVWKDAATQIFYSYSIAWGGLMTLSSYNKFNNDCLFDTIFVCVVNSATAIFAGFAIFSILGHMAHELNMPVSEVVDSGFSLAFIAYPEALTTLPVSPLWSILFFLMLLTLGFDTQFSTLGHDALALHPLNLDHGSLQALEDTEPLPTWTYTPSLYCAGLVVLGTASALGCRVAEMSAPGKLCESSPTMSPAAVSISISGETTCLLLGCAAGVLISSDAGISGDDNNSGDCEGLGDACISSVTYTHCLEFLGRWLPTRYTWVL
ncbi:sodium- and chloride-dependent neutral and basic amino acid transporter B(0+)-like isoform X3 [Lissotriton helveticus]